MKKLLFLTLFYALNVSCKKSVTLTVNSIQGKWKMLSVLNHANNVFTYKPNNLIKDVILDFTLTSIDSGTFTGNTPTNDIWNNDFSIGNNLSIRISYLSMTKASETNWGSELVHNLIKTHHYTFENGNLLVLITSNKNLVFEKL